MPVLLLSGFACVTPGGEPTPTPTRVGGELRVTAAPSPLVPTVLGVTVDGPEGVAWVEYGEAGAYELRTPESPAASHHELALLGLKASHTYQWRAVVDVDGERRESAPRTFAVPAPPVELLDLDVTVLRPEAGLRYALASVIRPAETSPPGHSYAAILDREGEWVWWVSSENEVIVTPELGNDGRSVVWTQYAFDKSLDTGRMVRVSLDGTTRTDTRLSRGHHDVVQHDDGSIAFLATSIDDLDPGGVVATDVIALGPEGMTDTDVPTVLYDQLRDFPLGFEATCAHIVLPVPIIGDLVGREWTHGNSLLYVAEEDAYYLNQKFTDWLLKIDAATGRLEWIMNGRGSDFVQPGGDPVWTGVDATSLWSHGHISEIWPGGGMMFDNGDHHRPPVSRAIELAWDEEAMTAEVVWEFPTPSGESTPALGDVRRMSNGDVLVTWAGLGEVTEVTRDGRIVWRAGLPADQIVGRIVPLDDLYAPAP